jgi:hypothetical protein
MRTHCYLQLKFWSNLFLKGCFYTFSHLKRPIYLKYDK